MIFQRQDQCPPEKPTIVLGENMQKPVIPFAQHYGFDYYKPGISLGSVDADLAANRAWLQGMINEGRTFIDIGRAPGRVDPSPFYLMESSLINQNSAPTISFSGFPLTPAL